MKSIYMDNGATSFPKAPGVAQNVYKYLTDIGASANRGAYSNSFEVEDVIFETRELLCSLFGFDKPENVVFTKNITESLNILMKGIFKSGDHVIVSSMEHNAVMRPLNALEEIGVSFSRVLCQNDGSLDPKDLLPLIGSNTKGVVMTHASNVCGTILNLEEVGKVCKEKALWFIIDAAQTAGTIIVDFDDLCADAIAFTGHKGLLGPQGIGGFMLKEELSNRLSTFIEGGTGSLSDAEVQPSYMPDKFEAGTPNVPGIYGLNASLKYLQKEGIQKIYEKEMQLMSVFLERLMNMDHVDIIGKKDIKGRTGVISVNFKDRDNGEMAHRLSSEFGIMTRSGMHCAPSAHKTLGTFPEGTVRFGFSHFHREEDILYAADCLYKLG
ncbi:aminotransferase class V-fold PLP-dependent enzyme [Herbivorax sp. ANBcel31]|uniref:aminotransferase class V-fold PLP-dependent enzyme n=1 Tax=Herbivorax sp. ANBcel31 TaxID=3069754 RepID=UPI0027AE05AA|nr:aminotransferase class V-fold PLP-dependent enzyme [Herbivorax sp. ANBcel31]MDQ2087244.1 aminotransferase class V-fold PLP-dependent enzyme [Herbivorax sp. ANBcel31]